jgi:hypothetical protein
MLTTVGSEKNFIIVKYNREFRLHKVFITGECPKYWGVINQLLRG